MQITKTSVTKILISDIINSHKLDPITVILEDTGPRQGKIIIECFGESWSAYWGGMGKRTISQFFCSCDEHYLAGKLSNIASDVIDYDAISDKVRKEIIKLRKEGDISAAEARDAFNKAENIHDEETTREHFDLLTFVFGDDCYYSLPEKQNHKYQYLCRIINTVKEAIKSNVALAA